ncbi:MAG TPA: flagellar hook-length control protein FliK [Sphingobium sp.]|uniref:flagellar hook-length control protein FliK n=1 Tax=Sphingobium sp. TaxID=1912891 RepID=UPI002ED50098
MTTATITSAIAVTGIAPAATSGANGPASDTSEQPFGTLVTAAQAAGEAEGKAAAPDGSAVPVPVPVRLAGTLVAATGQGTGAMPAAPVPGAAREEETGVLPVPDDLADKAAISPDRAADAKPGDAVVETPVDGPSSPSSLPVPALLSEAEVLDKPVAASSPGHRGVQPAAEEGAAEEPKPSRSRDRGEVKLLQALPEQPPPPLTAPQPQASSHGAMAVHLPRPDAMPMEVGDGEISLPEGRAEEAMTSTRQVADAGNSGPDRAGARLTGADAALPVPSASLAQTGDQGIPPGMSFGQAMMPITARASSQIYGGALAGGAHDQPVVSAEAGQMGQGMGVAIARGVEAGRDALLVRLDPAEMGRVHVRLSFDHDGAVRVAMSADSAVALDMLRREAGDLGRALNDAGVRADSQSFRFEGGGNANGFAQQRGGGEGGQRQQPGHGSPGDPQFSGTDVPLDPSANYRSLRSTGGLNLII